MSYENDISYLRAELEKSKRLHSEAVRKQLHTDVDIWSDDIKNIKHQIIVHAKAEAFDEILNIVEQPVKNIRALVEYNDDVKEIIKKYESEAE